MDATVYKTMIMINGLKSEYPFEQISYEHIANKAHILGDGKDIHQIKFKKKYSEESGEIKRGETMFVENNISFTVTFK